MRSTLEAISHAGVAISEALAVFPVDLPKVLQTIADQARKVAGAQYAALGIGTHPTAPFEPWVFSGMTTEQARAIGHHPRPVATLGAVARTGQVLRLADVRQHPAFVGLPPHHPPITSFLGVPIRYRARTVGNLYLGNKLGASEFSEDDRWAIELLAAHAAVALHRARLQYILENAPHGMLLIEADSGHLMSNNQATRLLGCSLPPEAGADQLLPLLRHPDGRSLTLEELPSSQVHLALEFQAQEMLVVRPDGRRVPVLVSAAPVRGPWALGQADVVVSLQDISAIKELERLREEWTFVIGHELRQPITVIVGYAGMVQRLMEQHACPEAERSAVAHVRAAAGNMQRMISDLLDVSRIETRRLHLERQPVDLPALVRAVAERTLETAGGARVWVEVNGEVPPVAADPGRLEQVLSNLLSNAAKYGAPYDEIRVVVARRDSDVQVSVVNGGPGITPDELPKLFGRFHRTRAARVGGQAGLGLGLYVSKGLVEAHGGRIWAESVPDQTTTFSFTLPASSTLSTGH